MKKFSLLPLFAALMMLAVSCGGSASQPTHVYAKDGLKLDIPFEMQSQELPLPAEVRALVEDMSTEMYASQETGMVFMVNHTKYKPEVGEVSLQGAVDGAIGNLTAMSGTSGVTRNEKDITRNGVTGKEVTGNWENAGHKFDYRVMIFVKDMDMWQVIGMYQSGKSGDKKIVDNIMESVSFE